MLALAAWAWAQTPAGAQVPIHWGVDGQPDGYASKEVALLLTPGRSRRAWRPPADFLPRFEPRAQEPRRVRVRPTVQVTIAVLRPDGRAAADGRARRGRLARSTSPVVLGIATGVLFVVIGNVLGKVRSNFMFGVRTPWTLSSDLSWNKTHRLVGRLFVLLGLAIVVTGLVGSDEAFLVGHARRDRRRARRRRSSTRTGSGRPIRPSSRSASGRERRRPGGRPPPRTARSSSRSSSSSGRSGT